MIVLLLEDDPNRIKAFKQRFLDKGWSYDVCHTAQRCLELLDEKRYDIVFLDHDLGDEQMVSTDHSNTGSHVARNWPKDLSTLVIIHSFNPVGAEYMHARIPGAIRRPGIWAQPF